MNKCNYNVKSYDYGYSTLYNFTINCPENHSDIIILLLKTKHDLATNHNKLIINKYKNICKSF
jgi:hypothetical protein